jgi:hypothetical protein
LVPDLYGSHGVYFEQTTTRKSDFYLDFLHVLHSRRILMLDEPTQIAELLALERRTAWGGKESVDHPQIAQAHDDAINALAGAAVLAAATRRSLYVSPELLARTRAGGSFIPPPRQPPTPAAPAARRGRLFISDEFRARLRSRARPDVVGFWKGDR